MRQTMTNEEAIGRIKDHMIIHEMSESRALYITQALQMAIEALENERPHGEWKTIEGFDGDEYYECSNCGEPWILMAGTPKDNKMNFCPNCGANMRGKWE